MSEKRYTVVVDEQTRDWLKRWAAEENKSMGEIVGDDAADRVLAQEGRWPVKNNPKQVQPVRIQVSDLYAVSKAGPQLGRDRS